MYVRTHTGCDLQILFDKEFLQSKECILCHGLCTLNASLEYPIQQCKDGKPMN